MLCQAGTVSHWAYHRVRFTENTRVVMTQSPVFIAVEFICENEVLDSRFSTAGLVTTLLVCSVAQWNFGSIFLDNNILQFRPHNVSLKQFV